MIRSTLYRHWLRRSKQVFRPKLIRPLCLCYRDYRFPFVAISIGLTINQEPVVGVIYNPILNQVMFYLFFIAIRTR